MPSMNKTNHQEQVTDESARNAAAKFLRGSREEEVGEGEGFVRTHVHWGNACSLTIADYRDLGCGINCPFGHLYQRTLS